MDVKEALEKRRAYRSLEPVGISDDVVEQLAKAAWLMPSCFNNQPWRFIFIRSKEQLARMKEAINKGNEWTQAASMLIAVMARKEKDCVIKEREYYLFDTGLATAALMLRATELGLVAHPIAGFDHEKALEILMVPAGYTLITLVVVGVKSGGVSPLLNAKQAAQENERPARRELLGIYSEDKYDAALDK